MQSTRYRLCDDPGHQSAISQPSIISLCFPSGAQSARCETDCKSQNTTGLGAWGWPLTGATPVSIGVPCTALPRIAVKGEGKRPIGVHRVRHCLRHACGLVGCDVPWVRPCARFMAFHVASPLRGRLEFFTSVWYYNTKFAILSATFRFTLPSGLSTACGQSPVSVRELPLTSPLTDPGLVSSCLVSFGSSSPPWPLLSSLPRFAFTQYHKKAGW